LFNGGVQLHPIAGDKRNTNGNLGVVLFPDGSLVAANGGGHFRNAADTALSLDDLEFCLWNQG
jgi:hypothetical protein